MCIFINRISWNVVLDGKPHLRTLALLSRGGIPPWTTFLDSYDQTSHFHSLTRTPMIAFTRPRTTGCPWIGPLAQHIYRYILLDLSHLHKPLNTTYFLWYSPKLGAFKNYLIWFFFLYNTSSSIDKRILRQELPSHWHIMSCFNVLEWMIL